MTYFPVFPGNYQYFPGITSISRRPGKYEYFPPFCQPCSEVMFTWIQRDSNPQPCGPKSTALTTQPYPPCMTKKTDQFFNKNGKNNNRDDYSDR